MAKKRMIDTRIWSDSYFSELSDQEKILFFYFLTNMHTDISGFYEVPLKQISAESCLPIETVKTIKIKFETDGRIFFHKDWVGVINFIKHQQTNPSIKLGIIAGIEKAPKELVERVVQTGTLSDTLSHLRESNLNKIESNSKGPASNEAGDRLGTRKYEGAQPISELLKRFPA